MALSTGRPAWDFPQRPALRSPDFPRRCRAAAARPTPWFYVACGRVFPQGPGPAEVGERLRKSPGLLAEHDLDLRARPR